MFDTFILCHFLLAAIDWASQGSNVFRQVIFDDVRNRGRDSLASENLKKKKKKELDVKTANLSVFV